MVSNSEGSFAGLATYVLVCWAIMVALLLNMSYLTMVAMHGKAATWVGPSDPEGRGRDNRPPYFGKGQLISKGLFDVIISTRKNNDFFKDFCPSL